MQPVVLCRVLGLSRSTQAAHFQVEVMPIRYTSRALIKLAEECGWRLISVKGDHHNFKHPNSRFVVTIVHPQKDVPVGRANDTVKKIRLEVK